MKGKALATGQITITAPQFEVLKLKLVGTAPFVQHKFSQKAKRMMLEAQTNGNVSKNKKKEPRNIQEDYEQATYRTALGEYGIPAAAFRCAMISACRLAGLVMTKAKLSVFVEADDYDVEDGTALVILDGEPELHQSAVRLESGVASIAVRPMWRKWSVNLRIRYDAGQYDVESIVNLLKYAGMCVGVGEGRPDSKKSTGMGWGLFAIDETAEFEITEAV